MTAKEMTPAIGATVEISTGVGEMTVTARVLDAKTSWNQVRLLVAPLAGTGTAWIELSRLRRAAAPTMAVAR